MPAASDDFNRPDGALGANWTAATSPGGQIVGGAYGAAQAALIYEGAFWNTVAFEPDQFSQGRVAASPLHVGVGVRMSAGGNWYGFFNDGSVVRSINGSAVQMTALGSGAPAGSVMKVTIVGQRLEVFVNSVYAGYFPMDNGGGPVLTSGQPGVVVLPRFPGGRIDDWSGGDFSVPSFINIGPVTLASPRVYEMRFDQDS